MEATIEFEYYPNVATDPVDMESDTCPACQGRLSPAGAIGVRLDAENLENMAVSSASEEKVQSDIVLKVCFTCGYSKGRLEVATYAGY